MRTNDISKFAAVARVKLINGIANKLTKMGYDKDGVLAENCIPKPIQGGVIINNNVIQDNTYFTKWQSLEKEIKRVGIKQVIEETAYTWFNRLMAIRILQKNGLAEPVIEYIAEGIRIPKIVDQARHGVFPKMSVEDKALLDNLLQDETLTQEQFSLLITAYCHDNVIISKCFGNLNDYSDLLVPDNILLDGELLDLINQTDYITDDDFKSPELIGWLYQFYISERKDEVFDSFKKGKKAGANEIPAATQIFTPNWIVKYMVQNTIGRIYLDNFDSSLGDKWQYLVEPAEPTPDDCKLKISDPAEFKFTDPGCGSGHILVEAFDIFMQIYDDQLYSKKEAIELILSKNVIGIDIDTRAKQLATFSLLLKACQIDNSFADAHLMPRVLDMPTSVLAPDAVKSTLDLLEVSWNLRVRNTANIIDELRRCFDTLKDANVLGSIMKFDITSATRSYLEAFVEESDKRGLGNSEDANLIQCFKLILALTDKYSAIVANPPYMGIGNMDTTLSNYAKANYDLGKTDLCTCFVILFKRLTCKKGQYAYIIPPSWLFLSSFEGLRKDIIETNHVESLLHLSRGVFGADFGSACSVIKNYESEEKGTYFRLVERTFQEFDQNHLRILFEKALKNKLFRFCFKDYTKEQTEFDNNVNGNLIFYTTNQNNFKKIPGYPFAYWVKKNIIDAFKEINLGSISVSSPGIRTGRDSLFIKDWYEVSYTDINLNGLNVNSLYDRKWFPVTRGGERRTWFGNLGSVILGHNNFERVQAECPDYRLRESEYYFKEGITWTMICSGKPSFRLCPMGVLFGNGGPTLYSPDNFHDIFAFLNSKPAAYIMSILNPTINYTKSDIGHLPILKLDNKNVKDLVDSCVLVSRTDWDSHETSWDFKKNELLAVQDDNSFSEIINDYDTLGINLDMPMPEPNKLSWCYNMYTMKWQAKFNILHNNEEELNRQFIDIYGLQDELTPDVPLNEVTILQQGEISIKDNQLEWHADVVMKQLISYAMGCVMGRYKLGTDGLHIADMNTPSEMIAPYEYKGYTFRIDDDGIVPLMQSNCNFPDNALLAVKEFIRVAFGDENHTDNLNFLEECLGCNLEQYLYKEYWKDHKKMYQNRPIYWLFSSKKGAFQAILYMHRYNASTLKQLREHYLLKHIEYLRSRIEAAEADFMNLTAKSRKEYEKNQKDLEECLEYDERLHEMVDNQIALDLDDGVVVNYAKMGDIVAKLK